jgi:ketosteroid isomerase-like protein
MEWRCVMAQPTVGALSAKDTAAIRSASEQFSRFLLAQDFDALVQLYTDDGVFMPPHQPAVNGRSALRSWMAAFPKVTQFALEIGEIDGREDLAYVRGRYSMTLHPDGAPGPVDDVGKYIEIRKKQPDGSWLMAADIFNSDTP